MRFSCRMIVLYVGLWMCTIQMIYFGLHTIVPLMSEHLLRYPKLCHLVSTSYSCV